jgi:hypothetical protein
MFESPAVWPRNKDNRWKATTLPPRFDHGLFFAYAVRVDTDEAKKRKQLHSTPCCGLWTKVFSL